MPRKIQRKCLECSLLSIEEARALHGEQGDGCWEPKICHRRRSHYRNRGDNNAKRRGQLAAMRAKPGVETISVAAPLVPVAFIYLYREARKDAHLHAVAVTVWRGEEKLLEVQPIHCIGMTNRQVNHYLRDVLSILKQEYGISEFEPEIRLEPMECPLSPCPLKER